MTEEDTQRVLALRNGENEPLHLKMAAWDGFRSIRLEMPQGSVGLATATYSYQLTHWERVDAAERLAALWNLAAAYGWDTRLIETLTQRRLAESDAGVSLSGDKASLPPDEQDQSPTKLGGRT